MANAGVSTIQHVHELTDDEWDVNFNVNARGVFLTNQIVARISSGTARAAS
jgi:meso-butanediol dehydrogenase/(S,S)-butanediol dehydrogenase/diacetyl reductase